MKRLGNSPAGVVVQFNFNESFNKLIGIAPKAEPTDEHFKLFDNALLDYLVMANESQFNEILLSVMSYRNAILQQDISNKTADNGMLN